MARILKIALLMACGLLACAAIVVGYIWYAMGRVQPFYRAAIEVDRATLESASRQLEGRVETLVNDAQQASRWQATFSQDEVNGWLAVALAEKYPDLLPDAVSEPRLAFTSGRIQMGFRYQGSELDTIFSLTVEPSLQPATAGQAPQVAVRIVDAHAGTLDVPLYRVMDQITQTADEADLSIAWKDDEPVAMIPLADLLRVTEQRWQIEAVEIDAGKATLSGSTTPPDAGAEGQPATALSAELGE